MFEWFAARAAWFGIHDLDFWLTDEARSRLIWASAFGFLLVSSTLISFVLTLTFDPFVSINRDVPGFWRRVEKIATLVPTFMLPLSLAVLFLNGIGTVSRAMGSWALLIAAVLTITCLGFGTGAVTVFAVTDDPEQQLVENLRVRFWLTWASLSGFLAVGYAFLAYRGLSGLPLASRTVIRNRRSRTRPRTRPPGAEG